MPKYRPHNLGPLPIDAINATLGTELEPGEVYLSAQAHQHIARDHGDVYEVVMGHLEVVISAPNFVGQAPHHRDNMELVRRIQLPDGRGYVLVAIGLEPDEKGFYRVKSSYLIEEWKVESRRSTDHLRLLKR